MNKLSETVKQWHPVNRITFEFLIGAMTMLVTFGTAFLFTKACASLGVPFEFCVFPMAFGILIGALASVGIVGLISNAILCVKR